MPSGHFGGAEGFFMDIRPRKYGNYFMIFCKFSSIACFLDLEFSMETCSKLAVHSAPRILNPKQPYVLILERRVMKLFSEKMRMIPSVQRFLVSEDGPTAVEYAVMLALIIIVCLTAVAAVGTSTSKAFDSVSSKLHP